MTAFNARALDPGVRLQELLLAAEGDTDPVSGPVVLALK